MKIKSKDMYTAQVQEYYNMGVNQHPLCNDLNEMDKEETEIQKLEEKEIQENESKGKHTLKY